MRNGNNPLKNLSARREAERKREQRDRMRADGFKPMQYWVHADDAARVKKYVGKLRAARTGVEGDDA